MWKKVNKQLINVKKLSKGEKKCKQLGLSMLIHRKESFQSCLNYKLEVMVRFLFLFWKKSPALYLNRIFRNDIFQTYWSTPVGINEKGFVNSNFGMFLLLDYCIENERGSVGMQLCRVLINISFKSSKIVYFSQNCYFHVM